MYDDLLHCKNCIQKTLFHFIYMYNVYTTGHARKTETFVIQINYNL